MDPLDLYVSRERVGTTKVTGKGYQEMEDLNNLLRVDTCTVSNKMIYGTMCNFLTFRITLKSWLVTRQQRCLVSRPIPNFIARNMGMGLWISLQIQCNSHTEDICGFSYL